MDEDAEKMVALKKAYADIILNTAKEAAARIMASERKALLFQRDLFSTKDEALRMLLRLKQMMDSKTTEMEKTSSNNRRRIKELKAQLEYAEDTIVHLRTELKQAQSKLDDKVVNKNNNNHVNVPPPTEEEEDHQNGSSFDPIVESAAATTDSEKEAKSETNIGKILDGNFCLGDNPNLASMIMRSKESEQYRNGCTQRIRAFETNEELPPPEEEEIDHNNQQNLTKTEKIIVNNPNESAADSKLENNGCVVLNSWTGLVQVQPITYTCKDQNVRGPQKKLRKYRFRKTKPKCMDPIGTSRRSLSENCQQSSFLSRCRTFPVTGNVNTVEDGSKIIETESDNYPKCTMAIEEPRLSEKATDTELMAEPVPVKESGDSENPIIPETSAVAADDSMPLKYTFSRKRKKERVPSIIGDENISPGSSSNGTKKMAIEKQNGATEAPTPLQNPSESSRQSRRVAQVARQLISLSGKRWR